MFLAAADLHGQAVASPYSPSAPAQTYLLIRADDAGMSHSVNMAIEGTAPRTPEFTEVTVRLAREFGSGMSRYFGETMASPQYAAGELYAITSSTFRNALKSRSVQLITYRDLIQMHGLTAMRPPRG